MIVTAVQIVETNIKMSTYIIIKNCKTTTAWYADKIGHTFKVDENVEFPDVYTIRISHKKGKANYGVVDLDDAEIITPTLVKKIQVACGWNL